MIYVVGAVAMDMIAIRDRFSRGTSNPAEIRLDVGGVGYRIYRGLATPQKRLITAVGRDYAGGPLERALAGDDRVFCRQTDAEHSAVYMAMMESGDLLLGASDMSVIRDGLDPELVLTSLGDLEADDILVLEANLSPRLVARLLEAHGDRVRIVFQAVSVEKAAEHSAVLRGLFLVSATEDEAGALLSGRDRSPADVRDWLSQQENRSLLVTRGARGASLHTTHQTFHARPPEVIAAGDTTGAGDRLLAHYINALSGGASEKEALAAAVDRTAGDIKEGRL